MTENKISGKKWSFDLRKIETYDKNTDHNILSQKYHESAVHYYTAALILRPRLELTEVALTNAAFSCELFLKAILHEYQLTVPCAHDLESLFKYLPPKEQEFIKTNIGIENREVEFLLTLHEMSLAFQKIRYIAELKGIVADINFLFAFAHILKFVHESVRREKDVSEKHKDSK